MGARRRRPIWLDRIVLDAVHLDTIRTHGGLLGVRDENALESALARPRNLYAYGRKRDLAALSAAYGFALARSHLYRDGNKRVAFLAMVVFLGLNGFDLEAAEEEVVSVMVGLAAGSVTERSLAGWIRSHAVPASED
ncbi:MAG: type II toxin-antitoxin system death-on-curing family toxin [Candidatus Eisenbacteria bacterium]|nr:type II toxin-antitoxin system death-on-curing family toxin [Candidatus Eisenbacteria bacterium]